MVSKEAQAAPLKAYLRLLLDMPKSSNEATAVFVISLAAIFLSIILLFWQTLVGGMLSVLYNVVKS